MIPISLFPHYCLAFSWMTVAFLWKRSKMNATMMGISSVLMACGQADGHFSVCVSDLATVCNKARTHVTLCFTFFHHFLLNCSFDFPLLTSVTSLAAMYLFEPFSDCKRALPKKRPTYEHSVFPLDSRVPLTTMRPGSVAPIPAAALGNKVMSAKSSQSALILCENVESSATFSLPSHCLFKILCKSHEAA